MSRDEHLVWAKKRALAYLPGNIKDAITSMLSDMSKHEELQGRGREMPIFVNLAFLEMTSGTPDSARSYINGFN